MLQKKHQQRLKRARNAENRTNFEGKGKWDWNGIMNCCFFDEFVHASTELEIYPERVSPYNLSKDFSLFIIKCAQDQEFSKRAEAYFPKSIAFVESKWLKEHCEKDENRSNAIACANIHMLLKIPILGFLNANRNSSELVFIQKTFKKSIECNSDSEDTIKLNVNVPRSDVSRTEKYWWFRKKNIEVRIRKDSSIILSALEHCIGVSALIVLVLDFLHLQDQLNTYYVK